MSAGEVPPTPPPGPWSGRRPITRRRVLAASGGALLGASGLAAYARWIEPERIAVSRVRAALAGWPAGKGSLRIGHVSDLHCDSVASVARAARAAKLLMAERPDVVFLTGDYVTSHGEQWGPACADALAIVASAPLGAFAVLGNHDWWSDSQEIIQRELARIGVVTLANSAARLRPAGNVWAVGVETLATGQEDVGVAAARTPGGAVRFLLVHEPDFADRVRVPIAMQFSGHSHGGQVRIPGLPSWTPAGARRYVAGLYRSAPHPLFVTRGVGVIGPPVRFRCPPEVAVIEVVPERRGAAVGTGPSAAA